MKTTIFCPHNQGRVLDMLETALKFAASDDRSDTIFDIRGIDFLTQGYVSMLLRIESELLLHECFLAILTNRDSLYQELADAQLMPCEDIHVIRSEIAWFRETGQFTPIETVN